MDDVLFSGIFRDAIKPLLLPMGLYNMFATCKYYAKNITYQDFKIQVIKEINRRLREIYGKNYVETKQKLKRSGAIIVGSFITQCVLGEYWDSNVDICVAINANKFLPKNFELFCYPETKDSYGLTIPPPLDHPDTERIGLKELRTFFIKNRFKVKLMGIDTNNILDHVKYHYHYNICKIIYQFKHIDSDSNDLSTNNLQIYNLDDIVHRRTNICANAPLHGDHFKKYYVRGFNFYLADDKEKKILSTSDLHEIMCLSMPINVTKIDYQTKSESIFPTRKIRAYDYVYTYTIIKNEICCYHGNPSSGIIRLYKIHKVKIPDNLVLKNCRQCSSCFTELLFPNQKHLHSNLGVFILTEI
uniref:Uncharacterized protein n=1 Tax=viral metagenome TaxID=1070528 RepID=A0A6C0CB06_9ZZZZ